MDMKPRTWVWAFLFVCCALAFAQAPPLTPAPVPAPSSGLPGWAWGIIILACVCGGLFLYLRKKNPAAAATVATDASVVAAHAGAIAAQVAAEVKVAMGEITAQFHKHVADANANAASANANAAAAIAKIPTLPPLRYGPKDPQAASTAAPASAYALTLTATPPAPAASAAIAPADSAGTVIAPAPTTGAAPMPNQPYSVAPPNPSRDINIEGPAIVRWLNGAQEDVNGVPLNPPTPPAHEEVPDAFSRYWTTIEALWPAHPEWGTGPASWELAYQAAVKVAGTASSSPRVSLPLPTSGPDLLVVTHYNLQETPQSKARFYSDNQAILGRYMFNLDGINQVMLLLSRNTGGLLAAVYDQATNTYVMPDGRTLDQWSISELGLDK